MSSIWHYVLASRRSRALPSIAAMQLLLLTSMLRLALHLYAKHTGICRMSLISVTMLQRFLILIINTIVNTNCNHININLVILSDLFNMILQYMSTTAIASYYLYYLKMRETVTNVILMFFFFYILCTNELLMSLAIYYPSLKL